MNMFGLVEAIKEVVVSTVESMKLPNVMFGTVRALEPLEVFVDQRLTLPAAAVIVPKHLLPIKASTVEEYPKSVDIDNALRTGDHVVLMRVQGGQKYVVIGRN